MLDWNDILRWCARRWLIVGVLLLVGLLLSTMLDGWFYEHFHASDRTVNKDWFKTFRVTGNATPWLIVAAALIFVDTRLYRQGGFRAVTERAALLALGIALSAGATEILKLLVRRERPLTHDGGNFFRPFTESPLKSGGLAFPSSHTTVAFAAALVLCRFFPRAWPVWLAFAIGCGLTRIAERAHFFSDTVGAAIVAAGVTFLLFRVHHRNVQRRELKAAG